MLFAKTGARQLKDTAGSRALNNRCGEPPVWPICSTTAVENGKMVDEPLMTMFPKN
jgi:hypothetical protein